MATPRTRGPRGALASGLALLLLAACGGPSPQATSPVTPPPVALSSPAADTLRIAVPADPSGFIVPTDDVATTLVQRFLQAALYRLDGRLVPQPDLAAAAPLISADGLTWRVTLAAGRHFSDGTPVTAADVVRTYQLALSPDCPFGALCTPVGQGLAAVASPAAGQVVFTLHRPWAPFEADVLAALPVLPAAALAASLARLLAGAHGVTAAQVTSLVDAMEASTSAAACAQVPPPPTCDPAFYIASLQRLLGQAGVAQPAAAAYRDADGQPDPSAYGTVLLGRLEALATVLGTAGTDQAAAALPILDLQQRPIGAGPFSLVRDTPGQVVDMTRWGPSPGAGAPTRVEFEIISDPSVAATALQAGDVDWVPDVAADLVRGLATSDRTTVAARPSDTLRLIVFNVRPGHPYADPAARAAFVACLDPRVFAADGAAQHAFVATDLLAPGSWAAQGSLPWADDAATAQAALQAAGWRRGADGIYARLGLRLASSVAVRPAQTDLLALMTAAAARLRACGIDLDVQATTLSGADLLATLEYPNTFETYLASQPAGLDPDDALGRLASARATTILDPGDADFGGWQDAATDHLLAQALQAPGPAARAALYGELERRLASQAPVLPLIWDPAYAAVDRRVTAGGRTVDPGVAGYDRDLLSWRLAGP